MRRKTISRRDALGIIGKAGVSLVTGTYFFLSLRTSPLAAAPEIAPVSGKGPAKAPGLKAAPQIVEKVVISGSDSTLVFKISGPAGRHCGVSFATTNAREHYKPAANARGLIGENGLATIEVDAKGLPNGKIFIRVVTGASGEFNKDPRGTQAFEVTISNGVVTKFGGVRERPLEGAAIAATCATAGYDPKIR
jgi:hypothetical protein